MKTPNWFLRVLVLFVLILGVQCKKDKVQPTCSTPKPVPGCIREKIDLYLQYPKTDPSAEIWQYRWNGKIVYYFPNQVQVVVDGCSELYDEQCKLLCNPSGCFTGNGDGRCPEFFTQRTNEILLWRDTR